MAGSPIPKIDDPFVLARFFSNVEFGDKDSCWGWSGFKGNNGYGRFSYKDASRGAHRVSYQIFYGPIPDGLVVCHKCDNKECTNPLHLWLGTQSDNLKDAANKGRMYRPDTDADKNGNTKMTWDMVRKMRQMSSDGYKNSHLASLFQVSPSTVRNIINYETWKEPSNA